MRTLKQLDATASKNRKRHRLIRRQYHNKVVIEVARFNLRMGSPVHLSIQYSLQGPNRIWHCDGNDKLKMFGFVIHGCIDG